MEVEGFKAFTAPQSFDIDGGHVFVFGRNGLGKSSVIEAVRWCLFGLADRPEVEVRNVYYPTAECRVELELEGLGGRWRIQRRLRPGSGRSDLLISDPDDTIVPLAKVFPHLARLGPHEGTHIIFASQQSTHRRPQADITRFDKVLYSYLRIDDVPDLLDRLDEERKEQAEVERQLAEELNAAEEALRSKLSDLGSRVEEILNAAPWPGGTVPTNADTETRIRTFVDECGGSLKREDGGDVTHEWLLGEAERAIQQMTAETQDVLQQRLTEARNSLQELAAAKEEFEELSERFQTEQTRVETCKDDLKSWLGDKTKQQLLTEHGDLVRQNNQLAQYLALVQQAVDYFEKFSPEECPVCDTGVGQADVLSRLQGRVGSDVRAADIDSALKKLQARLDAIYTAEASLAEVRTNCASVESSLADARIQFEGMLDDPADHLSSDRTVLRLEERIRELELTVRESADLVAIKRSTLKGLQQEARFQRLRSREENLRRNLELGLEPAREAHREFVEVLGTLDAIREALQEAFNSTLNGKLPDINELMTEVYGRLTQQVSFPKIVVESGPADEKRTLRVCVTSDSTPKESFEPSEVLNGQAVNAVNLVPYFVFSKFQAEALELDWLLIDDPSQSFDTSRVELLMRELAAAATHAQLLVASHEDDRFEPLVRKHFKSGVYRVFRVTSFARDDGPKLECSD